MEAAIRANHQYGKSRRSILIFQPGRQVCSETGRTYFQVFKF
jgi:hypothetical protein